MNYLFFDTETSGLPKSWMVSENDIQNWPRIIQLGCILANEQGQIMEEYQTIIQPIGFSIDASAASVHGISHARAMKDGIPVKDAMHRLEAMILKADMMVAHNINFDFPIVNCEFLRLNQKVHYPALFCTMLSTCEFVGIEGNYGTYKWPKLEELYIKLFGHNFDGAHNAMADVQATTKCFFELKSRGII
ncbi:3'-5' exonuclease [Limibacter armeniacum]|uniref:3'-5' exonuclease n=1 Tax=Limibacter armeniacum TaxID=466084 RepID=UPI002FE6531F